MAYVQSITLQDIGGFARVEIPLHEHLTVLVGVNGSGKPTVLEALAATLSGGQTGRRPLRVRRGANWGWVEVTLDRDTPQRLHLAEGRAHFPHGNPWSSWSPLVAGVFYDTDRNALDRTPDVPVGSPSKPGEMRTGGLYAARTSFEDLFRWFYYMENAENEVRARQSAAHRIPQLQAVREAIAGILVGFSEPWVERDHPAQPGSPRFTLAKGGERFLFDELSEGERAMAAMVADLSRRLAIANPGAEHPNRCPGLVLVDEIELHLHPAWQRAVLGRLRDAFPAVQLVVTTHSPQVLSEVDTASVRVLDGFQAYASPPVTGRDSNLLLETVFQTDDRPRRGKDRLGELARLIDEDDLERARLLLADRARELGADAPDLVGPRTLLHVLDAE